MLMANTIIIGVIITICSNNWISIWMGLEISLLSFIPFIQTSNKIRSESIIKYFIIQRVASTILLFRVVIILIGVNIINEIIICIAILIKLGAAPFHNWVIIIIEIINYYRIIVILTILKLPPITIIYQINSNILRISIILRIIIRSIICLNQTSIRKVLAYSSVYNIAIILLTINEYNITVIYLTLYSIIVILFVKLIKNLKINFINQLVLNEFNITIKINLWINILSIGGFPLTIGFIRKLLVIQLLITNKEITILVILLTTSILVIIFYLRIAFTSIINISSSFKWLNNRTKFNYSLIILNIIIVPLTVSITRIS